MRITAENNPRKTPPSDGRWFYQIILFLLIAVLAVFLFPYIKAESMWSDEGLYGWYAQKIFHDPRCLFSAEMTEHHPPLFSATLALGHFFLPPLQACHAVMIVYALLGVWIVFQLGAALRSPFVGLVAASMMAATVVYFVGATKILSDLPFMVLITLAMLFLARLKEKKPAREDFWAGLGGVLVILTKTGGYLIIPIVAAYYFFGLPGLSFKERFLKFLAPFFLMAGVTLAILLNNQYHLGETHAGQSVFCFGYYPGFLRNIQRIISFLGGPLILIWLLWGLLRQERRVRVILFFWFMILLSILGNIRIADDNRFVMYLFAPWVLMFGVASEKVIDLLARQREKLARIGKVLLGGIFFIFAICQILGNDVAAAKFQEKYVGYRQAGQIVKKLYRPGMLVLAGSERQMRYCTGIDYQKFGGDLMAFRQRQGEFEQLIENERKDILLIIDVWERLQPKWASPDLLGALPYLESLGFDLKVAETQPMFGQNGDGRQPILMILERKF